MSLWKGAYEMQMHHHYYDYHAEINQSDFRLHPLSLCFEPCQCL